MTLKKEQRLIFVGGAPRSGTTLVQNTLDSHPDILGGPEFLHVPDILGLKVKLDHSIKRGYIDLICSSEDVNRCISSLIKDLLKDLLLPLADKNGCKYLSEKTPENILVFSEMTRLFPEAHFIHVIRDPRATVSSLLEVGIRRRNKGLKSSKHTVDIQSAIRHTKRCLDSGFLAAEVAPERVLPVVYEQLVTEPMHETMRICEFLGIEWSSNMINPGKFKHLGEQAITVNSDGTWYDPQTYNRDPDIQCLDKWKASLKPTQKVIVSMSFKDHKGLNRLGYDLSVNDVPAVRRFLGFSVDDTSTIRRFWGAIYHAYTGLTNKVIYRTAWIKATVKRQFFQPRNGSKEAVLSTK